MLREVLSNKWFKRILGSAGVAFFGTVIIGGCLLFISSIWFSGCISISTIIMIFLIILALPVGCTCLYACNQKLWDSVHDKRDNPLFKLLPDIRSIVDFVEYVGDVRM